MELIRHFINYYTHEYGVSFNVSSASNGLECNLLGSQLLIRGVNVMGACL